MHLAHGGAAYACPLYLYRERSATTQRLCTIALRLKGAWSAAHETYARGPSRCCRGHATHTCSATPVQTGRP
eukprot:scaffold123291_cov30-Tisochrysis_lutea.AAC.1